MKSASWGPTSMLRESCLEETHEALIGQLPHASGGKNEEPCALFGPQPLLARLRVARAHDLRRVDAHPAGTRHCLAVEVDVEAALGDCTHGGRRLSAVVVS